MGDPWAWVLGLLYSEEGGFEAGMLQEIVSSLTGLKKRGRTGTLLLLL